MAMRLVRPSSESEKQTRTTVDTLEITAKMIETWTLPKFQRELKINAKVLALSQEVMHNGGVLPGIITLGAFDGKVYIVDGQHRLEAFKLAACPVGYVDVRTHFFESMGDMAKEYVLLNSSLVKLRPDDIFRGLESSTPALQRIRKRCPFIGYDFIRRNDKSPILSMSTFIRNWMGAKPEFPTLALSGMDALAAMDDKEISDAIDFAGECFGAWNSDREYVRLWSALNLSLCAWLYRRVVLGHNISARATRFTRDEFRKGLMSLSADSAYLDFLVGRNAGERDRAPAYARIRASLQRRYLADTGRKLTLPAPAWGTNPGGGHK